MTREEILAIPAGSEMDALVAEAMGLEKVTGENFVSGLVWINGIPEEVPNYSTDIADAWQVFEKLRRDMCWVNIQTSTKNEAELVVQWTTPETEIDYARAETAPLAICRAALIAAFGAE